MLGIYISVLKKYVVFKGRANRREFWLFFLANTLLFVLHISWRVYSLSTSVPGFDTPEGMEKFTAYLATPEGRAAFNAHWSMSLYNIYSYAIFLPSVALIVRRLHDVGKAAFWIVAMVVPVINLYALYLFAKKGIQGENQYGPEPEN